MSKIEHKYCLISTSYLLELFDIFIYYFIFNRIECVLVNFYQWGSCDAHHKEFESH